MLSVENVDGVPAMHIPGLRSAPKGGGKKRLEV